MKHTRSTQTKRVPNSAYALHNKAHPQWCRSVRHQVICDGAPLGQSSLSPLVLFVELSLSEKTSDGEIAQIIYIFLYHVVSTDIHAIAVVTRLAAR